MPRDISEIDFDLSGAEDTIKTLCDKNQTTDERLTVALTKLEDLSREIASMREDLRKSVVMAQKLAPMS